MLFHLGSLWRLLELGLLDPRSTAPEADRLGALARISSVSGGSITSAMLGLRFLDVNTWEREKAVERFKQHVVTPAPPAATLRKRNCFSYTAQVSRT